MPLYEHDEFTDFAQLMMGKGAMLGLDLGSKTIGLAICDAGWLIASPLETIRRKKFTPDAQYLIDLIRKNDVRALVLGMPFNMDGSEGPRCQSTRSFAKNFLNLHDIPVWLWDERLSSSAVDKAMLEDDRSRARRAQDKDQLAAAWILQGAIDRLSF